MSETTNGLEHRLRQQANAARVTIANADLHGPSAIPRADLARAAGTADRARRRGVPVDCAWPFNPEDTSPLAWWRTLPSDRLRDAEVLMVNATLARIDVMRRGDALAAALHGEVGATVAVALSLMPIREVKLEVDLAMTAVLRGAIEGDGLAALVLGHVLGRADIGHPFATELSASWLTHHLRHSPDQRRFTKREARLLAAMRERDELRPAEEDQ